ncbi:hypothetical protein JD844_024418 [Phrynosoma platyrhinos]|uniref:Myb/SANT-like DNA-binding domain-containing protein n=1 Tax=Phrynosoma platyrhinos TaxID=52577 RepID=A0ABQ7SYY4_PHRPL|nr:hypothetical protein JD844_024418 [Phrynosoma platyrhinos]
MPNSRWQWWLREEVEALLSIMGRSPHLELLMGSSCHPNRDIYRGIARRLTQRGFHRTMAQIRSKVKVMRNTFFCTRAIFHGDPPPRSLASFLQKDASVLSARLEEEEEGAEAGAAPPPEVEDDGHHRRRAGRPAAPLEEEEEEEMAEAVAAPPPELEDDGHHIRRNANEKVVLVADSELSEEELNCWQPTIKSDPIMGLPAVNGGTLVTSRNGSDSDLSLREGEEEEEEERTSLRSGRTYYKNRKLEKERKRGLRGREKMRDKEDGEDGEEEVAEERKESKGEETEEELTGEEEKKKKNRKKQ